MSAMTHTDMGRDARSTVSVSDVSSIRGRPETSLMLVDGAIDERRNGPFIATQLKLRRRRYRHFADATQLNSTSS